MHVKPDTRNIKRKQSKKAPKCQSGRQREYTATRARVRELDDLLFSILALVSFTNTRRFCT